MLQFRTALYSAVKICYLLFFQEEVHIITVTAKVQ